MVVFFTVAFLLIVATLLFLLPPLLQRQESKEVIERKQLNIMLYKDQLVELEADLRSGAITQEQYDQAHADLERSLLQDVSEDDTDKQPKRTVSGKINIFCA